MDNRTSPNVWPAPGARVTCSSAPGLVTIVLTGEIDLLVMDALEEALVTAGKAQPADVVVDLGGVTFVGSQALSFLVRLHHLTAGESRLTTLRDVPPMVRKAMITVGLDLLFALHEDGISGPRGIERH